VIPVKKEKKPTGMKKTGIQRIPAGITYLGGHLEPESPSLIPALKQASLAKILSLSASNKTCGGSPVINGGYLVFVHGNFT
jgi:hypothetical protein